MLNPNQAWQTAGLSTWCKFIPAIVKTEETVPPEMAMGRVFRWGYKAGVLAADHDFFETLKPELRQN